ncbi:hypothetical protein DLV22_24925 [Shigella boydii]|uniref:Fimbrial protein n=1 Tax=Shigella boydii TaxID=621 RepID=A0A8H9E1W1_SHIBO|nr:hypothetical protein [Escherichia coli]EGE3747784.1 hypothetical protein [Shigella boydii]EIT4384471.1 hypothetical protein [Escherichia coli]
MKKTLIALAVAASAVISGSAMAWTANGTGNSVELGGTLKPVAKVTPWEVKTGDAVTNLDALVQKGQKVVNVAVNQAIPVLGIRTQTKGTFPGQKGISPQIDFGNAINVAAIKNSEAVLTIDVKSGNGGGKIGTLSTSLLVGAEYSYTGPNNGKYVMVASTSGDGFFGGLPKDKSGSLSNPYDRIVAISGEFVEKYNDQGTTWPYGGGYGAWNFSDSSYQYSAFYGSGIEKGKNITITLDQAVVGDAQIQWKASLPVTVSYM